MSLTEEEKLFYAIDSNDVEMLIRLIRHGTNVDHQFGNQDCRPHRKLRWSLLHACCSKGRYDCATALLQHGADPDARDRHGMTPMMGSVTLEWRNLTELLLKAGGDPNAQDILGRAPLHFAARTEDARIIDILLHCDKDIQVDIGTLEGETPLWMCMSSDGHLEHAKLLLSAGSDVNKIDERDKRMPIQNAIVNADKDLIAYLKLLINRGAEVNTVDRFKHTLLMSFMHKMKKRGSKFHHREEDIKEMFHLLHTAGHDVNLMVGATRPLHYNGGALHMAADYGNHLVAKLILDHGGNPDIKNNFHLTPLHLATLHNDFYMVKLLLDNSCTLDTSSSYTMRNFIAIGTPFRFCLEMGHFQLAVLLLDAGHNISKESYLWTNEDIPQCLLENSDFFMWLKSSIDHWNTMLQKCRSVIRLHLTKLLADIERDGYCRQYLPVPPSIERYILLHEVAVCNNKLH